MAIDIKAPLADRLFALGTMTGTPDTPQFKGQGNRGSYHGSLPQAAPQQDTGDGRAKGLASIAGALIGAYSQAGTPAATNEQGNGFGLGGNLASGEVGSADYAGQRGLFSFGDEAQNAGANGAFDDFKYGNQPTDQTGLFNDFKYGNQPANQTGRFNGLKYGKPY